MLRSAASELTANGITVLGVSMDEVPKQRAFADKFGITFPLLCDTNGAICDSFNVPHPASKPARFTYLFYKQRLVWMDQRVTPAHQATHAIQAVKEHQASQE